ncbi:hypothetical protein HAX54_048658 [Datura stramonium]|uniref:Uncharacterized protein n=1 Tax=Datura stramonium TaxID=4076 RepID=A0ABS8WJJ3_DATST|nr:hypothetical protein [Datura stramonium]
MLEPCVTGSEFQYCSGGPCGASPLRPAFLTGTIRWFRLAAGSSGERLQFPTRRTAPVPDQVCVGLAKSPLHRQFQEQRQAPRIQPGRPAWTSKGTQTCPRHNLSKAILSAS